MSSLQHEVVEALSRSKVIAACVGHVLVWCPLGWFACGLMSESEKRFMAALVARSFRAAFVTTELEALQQATLWQIADDARSDKFNPAPIAPDLIGQPKPRAKHLKLVK